MAPERTTPLQREITRLSRLIAVLSVLLGAALFVVGRALNLPFWDNFVFAIDGEPDARAAARGRRGSLEVSTAIT